MKKVLDTHQKETHNIENRMEKCAFKKHKTPAELAFDACVYFTDDFSLYNAETGKYNIFTEFLNFSSETFKFK